MEICLMEERGGGWSSYRTMVLVWVLESTFMGGVIHIEYIYLSTAWLVCAGSRVKCPRGEYYNYQCLGGTNMVAIAEICKVKKGRHCPTGQYMRDGELITIMLDLPKTSPKGILRNTEPQRPK